MQKFKITMVLTFAAACVLGCDDKAAGPAGEKPAEAVAPKDEAKASDSKASDSKKPVGSEAEGMGLRCVKTVGPTKTIMYIGVVEREGERITVMRSEKEMEGISKEQIAETVPTSFQIDDGKTHETFLVYTGKAGVKGPSYESTFPPDDAATTYAMARRVHGTCSDWTIDVELLLPPAGTNFDVSLREMMDALPSSQ